ncbi:MULTISPECIES: hypothetical protein [Glycomyces]|uniref:Uncharacterized protein YqgV (UPF0045/DUF77 family) n=2 Tax=Glycomyces TaxID=58113 RepID=A0A9X3PPR2_9ACTN|nr:hypothetical protein [Glycomyces lechevalierae]MDA1386962.1 hypothetical protein [Glycomyces lechevalierae]MDR7341565.1 uncharacterized protein YqgV (UPF0045/DUF77 family) [Glycomyces lechevalierae]
MNEGDDIDDSSSAADFDVRVTVGPMRAAGVVSRRSSSLPDSVDAVEAAMKAQGLRVELVPPETEVRGGRDIFEIVLPTVVVLKDIGLGVIASALWDAIKVLRGTPAGEGRSVRLDITFRPNGKVKRFRGPCDPLTVEALQMVLDSQAVEVDPRDDEPPRGSLRL